jgi:hypothetical protein
MSPGSSRRAGGFSLVLRPTTTGGSFWEFDCFTVQKKVIFWDTVLTPADFLAGRRSGMNVNFMSFSRALCSAGLFEDVFDDLHFVFFAVVINHVKLSLFDGELDEPVHGEVSGLGPPPPQPFFRQVDLRVIFDREGLVYAVHGRLRRGRG